MTDDEIKLQQARREGFIRHCQYDRSMSMAWARREAITEFPITRTVPNTVTVNGRECRLYAGELQCRFCGDRVWYTAAYSDMGEAMRELLATPTKEVPE